MGVVQPRRSDRIELRGQLLLGMTTQEMNEFRVEAIWVSIDSVSFAKRFSRRPVGWDSKNDIGRRRTLFRKREWSSRELLMVPFTRKMALLAWRTSDPSPRQAYTPR